MTDPQSNEGLIEFREGEAWTCKTRPGEEDSLIVVGRIGDFEGEEVVHIQIHGVDVGTNAGRTLICHVPISREALSHSVRDRTPGQGNEEVFEEGFRMWSDARGGLFTEPVRDIVNLIQWIRTSSREPDREERT